MYHTRDHFIDSVVKIAKDTSPEDNEGQTMKGLQNDDTPELLQPDDGPGQGERGEESSLSTGAEKANTEGNEKYLGDAFKGFGSVSKQTQAELKSALPSHSSQSVAEKVSTVRLEAFSDELSKITGAGR